MGEIPSEEILIEGIAIAEAVSLEIALLDESFFLGALILLLVAATTASGCSATT